jgi:hypothetical protein
MATDSLPEEGELRLGAVMLPAGRRVVPLWMAKASRWRG